jgi:hypothetical protein
MGEALMLDGSADAAAFEAYVEQILAPSLRPGQIVILDNLSIHQGPQVKQAIEERRLPAPVPAFVFARSLANQDVEQITAVGKRFEPVQLNGRLLRATVRSVVRPAYFLAVRFPWRR